jgi:hypothetical protein
MEEEREKIHVLKLSYLYKFLVVKNLDLDTDSPNSLNLDPDSVKPDPQHGLRQ